MTTENFATPKRHLKLSSQPAVKTTRRAVVTGSASGIGAPTVQRLRNGGADVIGVDLRDSEVIADLASPAERHAAARAVTESRPGPIDIVVTCAGISGFTSHGGDVVVGVNYFGTVGLLAL